MTMEVTGTAGNLSAAEELKPVDTSSSTFVAEFERMDLTPLYEKMFMVAVNKQDRNKGLFLCNTLKGPFDFCGMVQAVSNMHREHMHHAKVIICDTDPVSKVKYLDAGTIDYLEANAMDIIFDATIGKQILDATCIAGVLENDEDSPLDQKKTEEV